MNQDARPNPEALLRPSFRRLHAGSERLRTTERQWASFVKSLAWGFFPTYPEFRCLALFMQKGVEIVRRCYGHMTC